MLRRRWPEVLDTLSRLKKTTWVLVSQNAQVAELDATTLKLSFIAPGLATYFRSGAHAEMVQRAVRETLGFDARVEPVLAEQAPTSSASTAAPEQAGRASSETASERGAAVAAAAAASWDAPAPIAAPVAEPRPVRGVTGGPSAASPSGPAVSHGIDEDDPGAPEPHDDDPGEPGAPGEPGLSRGAGQSGGQGGGPSDDPWASPQSSAPQRSAPQGQALSAREAGARAHAASLGGRRAPMEEDSPSPDDPDLASSGLNGAPLVAQMLGGVVIDEQVDNGMA